MNARITPGTLKLALAELAARDSDLARAHREAGPPPLRRRTKGFPALVRIVCSQQVSVASADAILGRLDAAVSPLAPEAAGRRRSTSFSPSSCGISGPATISRWGSRCSA